MKRLFNRVASKAQLSFLLLVVLGLFLNLPGTSKLPLMDRDEPKFAQATWEMMETGQFTIPYFNEGYRFDKPPLTYWWMRAHYHLLGKTEFAARLHSVLASIFTACLIYLIGSFLFSRTAGLLSGIGWLCCLQVLIHSRLCVADMPMLLGVTLTMYAAVRLLFAEDKPRKFGFFFWLLVAGLVIGFYAKGPVAWIVPILSVVLWRWPIGRKPIPWGRLQPISSLLIASAIVALWGVKAIIETDGGYWDVGIGDHVVKRGVSAFNGRVNIPLVYYLGTGFLSLLPWSPFLPGAILGGGTKLKDEPKRAFLVAWFITPFVVFALYATQLPHYILPGFPAAMLLLFSAGHLRPLQTKLQRRWFGVVTGLMLIISLIICAAGLLRIFPEPMDPVNDMILPAGLLILLVGVLLPVGILLVRRNLSMWYLPVTVAALATVLAVHLTATIRQYHPIILVREQGLLRSGDDTGFVAQGFSEPSWVFYEWHGKPWLLTGSIADGIQFMKQEPNPVGIFLSEEWRIGEKAIFAKFKNAEVPYLRDQRADLKREFQSDDYQITEFSGLNIARTTWVKIWLVQRN